MGSIVLGLTEVVVYFIVVKDLFSKKIFKVDDPQTQQAFAKGDLFEARIIPVEDHFEFSHGFCFHPKKMRGFIQKEIRKVRHQDKSRKTKLILEFSGMKLKFTRFKHIDPKHIYKITSKA